MTVEDMLRTGDRKEWREYLKTCTIQEAVVAHIKASRAGIYDMRVLAFKRAQHLQGVKNPKTTEE